MQAFLPPHHHNYDESQEQNYYSRSSPLQQEDGQTPKINTLINLKIIRWIDENQIYDQILQFFDLAPLIQKTTLNLSNLIRQISQQMNIVIDNYQTLLYYQQGKMFMNFGVYPFLDNHPINVQEFIVGDMLTIKLKKSGLSLIHLEMGRDMSDYMMSGPPKLLKGEEMTEQDANLKKKQSCIKNFQKIGYIVKKILSLKSIKRKRRINFNFKNDRNFTTKSIQDYFYQIKQGYKYNFDFNSNCNKNMKILRQYVKQHDKGMRKLHQKQTNQTLMI